MPRTWMSALYKYSYPVTLCKFKGRGAFPGFFTRDIPGDRDTTIEFEHYFRANSEKQVEPYLEVVFWKLYSQPMIRQGTTSRIAEYVSEQGIDARDLRCAVDLFVEKPTKANLAVMRALLGLKADVLATALTLPAFVDPVRYPMVDRRTAKWITSNWSTHNRKRTNRLGPFRVKEGVLRDNDFDNYLNWVAWCRQTAEVLTKSTNLQWRARDVEMAVFTAAPTKRKKGMRLNPLP